MRAAAPLLRRLRRLPVCLWQTSALSLCIFVVRTTGTDFYALLYCTVFHVLLLFFMLTFVLADFCIYYLLLLYVDFSLLEVACGCLLLILYGHSALRTMWLSAPVLTLVPVDVSH